MNELKPRSYNQQRREEEEKKEAKWISVLLSCGLLSMVGLYSCQKISSHANQPTQYYYTNYGGLKK